LETTVEPVVTTVVAELTVDNATAALALTVLRAVIAAPETPATDSAVDSAVLADSDVLKAVVAEVRLLVEVLRLALVVVARATNESVVDS